MAITYNKFNAFVQDLGRKVHNLNSDSIKIALSNTAPSAANTVLADITEIAGTNGYTAGGVALTSTSFTQTSGTAKLAATSPSPSWTASGGAMGAFRYIIIYNATASGSPLIAYWDRGASLTLNSGDTYTPTVDATNGVFTLA